MLISPKGIRSRHTVGVPLPPSWGRIWPVCLAMFLHCLNYTTLHHQIFEIDRENLKQNGSALKILPQLKHRNHARRHCGSFPYINEFCKTIQYDNTEEHATGSHSPINRKKPIGLSNINPGLLNEYIPKFWFDERVPHPVPHPPHRFPSSATDSVTVRENMHRNCTCS
jgi:hypothetical protein